ncbi:hypothetical protein ACHAXS_013086 [Conticribra weissflogii]
MFNPHSFAADSSTAYGLCILAVSLRCSETSEALLVEYKCLFIQSSQYIGRGPNATVFQPLILDATATSGKSPYNTTSGLNSLKVWMTARRYGVARTSYGGGKIPRRSFSALKKADHISLSNTAAAYWLSSEGASETVEIVNSCGPSHLERRFSSEVSSPTCQKDLTERSNTFESDDMYNTFVPNY